MALRKGASLTFPTSSAPPDVEQKAARQTSRFNIFIMITEKKTPRSVSGQTKRMQMIEAPVTGPQPIDDHLVKKG